MNNLEIRDIDIEDAGTILEVYIQCEDFLSLGPEPKATRDMVVEDIKTAEREGGIFRGIYLDGKLIGVVSYISAGFEGNDEAAFISLLMIAAPFRRKGRGTNIVQSIEKQILTDTGISTVFSAVQVKNIDAQRFWKRNGYHIIGGPESRPDGTVVFRLSKGCRKKE